MNYSFILYVLMIKRSSIWMIFFCKIDLQMQINKLNYLYSAKIYYYICKSNAVIVDDWVIN